MIFVKNYFLKLKKNFLKIIIEDDKCISNSESGFSLLELLITLAIFAILMVTTTTILVINLTIARRIKARSYAREETAFMLNVLKKDIRNADHVEEMSDGTTDSLRIGIVEGDGSTHCYRWFHRVDDEQVERKEIDCSTSADGDTSYLTPADVVLREFDFDIIPNENNWLVKLNVKAWTVGMPGDIEDATDPPQWLYKEVAVSTRNFD